MQSIEDTCTIDGCDLQRYQGRPMCAGHTMRQHRYGDPLYVPTRSHRDLTGQRFGMLTPMTFVPSSPSRRASAWECRCDCGATATVRVGDLNRGSVRSCGALHHQLEDDAEYTAAHDRVYRAKGRASTHTCVDCGRPASQWSYDHTDPDERVSATVKGNPPYSLNPDHYQPRCVPCHKAFDLSPRPR